MSIDNTLQEFNSTKHCIKCRGDQVAVSYKDSSFVMGKRVGEHLDCTCSSCGYSWKAKCAFSSHQEETVVQRIIS